MNTDDIKDIKADVFGCIMPRYHEGRGNSSTDADFGAQRESRVKSQCYLPYY